MAFISDDSMGQRTKVTWTDPSTYVDPNDKGNAANRQDGGWYFNKDTGFVEMWKSGGNNSASTSSSGAGTMSNLSSLSNNSSSTSVSLPETPKIDLQAEYDSLYESLGLSGMKDAVKQSQQQLLAARADADNAMNLVNENPFYSEGNRVGRIAKIEEAYNQKAEVLTAQSALKQQEYQDAQNNLWQQMDLKQQQYQYDYTAYQDNFNQMNYLLEKGALDDADETSLERMAATTGVSSAMLRSMINAQKRDNVSPQLLQNVDEYGNVTLTLIDANTNKLINQQTLKGVDVNQVNKSNATSNSTSASNAQTAKQNDSELEATIRQLQMGNYNYAEQQGWDSALELSASDYYIWPNQWNQMVEAMKANGMPVSSAYAKYSKYFDRAQIDQYQTS